MITIELNWTIDEDDNIIAPSGARVAKWTEQGLLLYDKRVKVSLLFTSADFAMLEQARKQFAEHRSSKFTETP